MRDFLCWEPNRVGSVINIDADFVPDEVFWAVHVDAPLEVRGVEEDSPHRTLEPKDLLEEFLSPDRNHFQLAILGQTGVGKSHLIHWMRQHIVSDDRRTVVIVRRLETNLRAILDKLIEQLPEDRRRRFKEELGQAGVMLKTRKGQKESLLNNLSVAIRQDHVRDDSGLPRDAEEFFVGGLPDLFLDPQLRRDKFLKEGEIIDQLVDRLFSSKSGRREAERLEFTVENLPLRNVDMAKASGIAQEVQRGLLYNQEHTLPIVLSIINRNVGDAISLSMNFSGDRLAELMGELRASLAEQSKELVLLFEEFARFQGYDSALLGALLVQGGDDICNIRWAIACTSGFYMGLPDTARARMTAIVDMDRFQAKPAEAPRHIERFAGRYLNAVRWGQEELGRAYQDEHGERAPSKCDDCEHRQTCHAAFGTSKDGYGLYPFTAKALEIMSERAGGRENLDDSDRFNPRDFQKGVLLPVLTDGGSAIASQAFPNAALHRQFGDVINVTPLERERLREEYGRDAERYVALFDLWAGAIDGRGLTSEVFEAFGLTFKPPRRKEEEEKKKKEKEKKDEEKENEKEKTDKEIVPADIGELRAWRDGGRLTQALSQKLRMQLFSLISSSIDWDALGLEQTKFAGATGAGRPFRQLSFVFVRQEISRQPAPVQFTLPFEPDDESDFNRTTTALETLLELEQHGGWTFPNADEKLATLLDLAERCSAEVVRQLQALGGDRIAWDPVAGAMELLAVTAALGGVLPESGADAEIILDRCFRTPADSKALHDDGLRKSYEKLRGMHGDLAGFVRAHCSGTKGGVVGRFLDPRRPLAALEEFIGNEWQLARQPQRLSTVFYKQVGDLYEEVARTLQEDMEREKGLRREWLERVEAAFGSNPSIETITSAAQKLVEVIHGSGLPVQSVITLPAVIERFKSAPFSRTVNDARALISTTTTGVAISCGHGHAENAALVYEFIAALQAVVQDVDNELKARERRVGAAGGDRIETATARIDSALGGLTEDLLKLQEWANAD